jgi:biotin transport system substrate-specific component
MMGTTGGYLVGMILATALVGWAADRGLDRSPFRLFAVMLAGVALILAFGYAWLATLIGADKAWQFGVVPFVVADVVKAALAASLIPAVWALFARR